MSPGSGPIDHSGHASLMSALLSALSVGGREPPLRSCRFEAVYCRNREDMSTPNYPLRPMRSTDSPSVRPSVSTWIFRGAYSAFGDVRCPFNLHCTRRFLDYLRCLVSGCIPARGGGGGSVGRLPPEAVGPWSGSLSLRRGSVPVSYSVENHPRSSPGCHTQPGFGRASGRRRLDNPILAYIPTLSTLLFDFFSATLMWCIATLPTIRMSLLLAVGLLVLSDVAGRADWLGIASGCLLGYRTSRDWL